MPKRVFLIVLDSFGMGELPDAAAFGDEGSNTLAAVAASDFFSAPHLSSLGLFNIDGATGGKKTNHPLASYARLAEKSPAKDTTVGHWEIAGIVSDTPLPLYPDGFPDEVLSMLKAATGYDFLCNLPYSGTELLKDYGDEHLRTGKPILYTSGDSVMQIAAHEDRIPLDDLYALCAKARELMQAEHAVGRIIARPFTGTHPYTRTAMRRDYSLPPPGKTMMDYITDQGMDVISVGKISDIFAGQGITRSMKTKSNADGMAQTLALTTEDFHGLCFVNLVDFDMLYGHRNDRNGYAGAITDFDSQLGQLLPLLRSDDLLLLTADHGCDPLTPSTDHSREYVPLLLYGHKIRQGENLGTRSSFSDIAATIQEYLSLPVQTSGESFLNFVLRG